MGTMRLKLMTVIKKNAKKLLALLPKQKQHLKLHEALVSCAILNRQKQKKMRASNRNFRHVSSYGNPGWRGDDAKCPTSTQTLVDADKACLSPFGSPTVFNGPGV